jgi:hypothetical protein
LSLLLKATLAHHFARHNRGKGPLSTPIFRAARRRLSCLDALWTLCKARVLSGRLAQFSRGRREDDMATTFDKREEGFEKQFAHDEELRFKATARRNKLLGLWVAEKLGMSGAEANVYAKDVVMADFEEAGEDDVFRKVRKDLDDKKVGVSDQDIKKTMVDLMGQAIEQIKAGK